MQKKETKEILKSILKKSWAQCNEKYIEQKEEKRKPLSDECASSQPESQRASSQFQLQTSSSSRLALALDQLQCASSSQPLVQKRTLVVVQKIHYRPSVRSLNCKQKTEFQAKSSIKPKKERQWNSSAFWRNESSTISWSQRTTVFQSESDFDLVYF